MTRFYSAIFAVGMFLCTLTALAQPSPASHTVPKYFIRGILCDSLTRHPEPFATVRLLRSARDARPQQAVTTDAEGRFTLVPASQGQYILEAIVIGKNRVSRSVALTDAHPHVLLDTLYIQEYGQSLGTAEVRGSKSLVKAEVDKISYSTADDPEAQSSTMLDMLRKVPMVTVDGEDNIQVNGNSGFKVYVDGKPNQMMSSNPSLILKNYPASIVSKVEVVTSPGARYDAEGVGAVLNIVTKAKTQTSGYVFTPSFQKLNNTTKGYVFGMFQLGKLMLSVNSGIGGSDGGKKSFSSSQREIFADPVNHYFNQNMAGKNKMLYHFENIMASYEFTPKDLLSISADLYGHDMKSRQNGSYEMHTADWQPVYSYGLENATRKKYLSVNTEVDYQHTFRPGTYLTFSYNLQHHKDDQNRTDSYVGLTDVPENFGLRDLHALPVGLSSEHTAQVDFTGQFKEHHTFSAGLKFIHRYNRSDNEEYSRLSGAGQDFVFDPEASLRYRHKGDIGAAYMEYTLRLGQWTMQAGQRYECYHAEVSYADNRRPSYGTTYNNWVPSVNLGYSFNSSTLLKAGYNLRIGRPEIGSLSPYVSHNSPLEISYGNPNLGTTTTHNLNATFSYFKPKVSVNVSFTHSFSNDGQSQYSFIQDDVQHTTYGNFLHSKSEVLNTYLNWNIVPGSSINLNATGMYVDYKSNAGGQHNSGFSGTAYLGYNQRLPWNMNFGLWAGGGTSSIRYQGTSPGYYYVSTFLKKSFLKDKRLELMLTASNFFERYVRYHHSTVTDQFRFDSNSRIEMLRFGVGVTYRLGSLRSRVKKTHRSIENDDVIETSQEKRQDK